MITTKESRSTGMANSLILPDERFFPRTKDRLQRLISSSNLNVSKAVFEFILNNYLKRKAEPLTISGFDKARSRARRIIFGFKVNCYDRRDFNWSDIMSCFKIGRFLYQVLSLISNDLGYKSLFTYNLTLFLSYINEFNPLTYQILNCSPFYQPIFSRTLETWHTFSYRECKEMLRQSFQQKWNNFSFDKKFPLVQAISCCKAIFIIYWLYCYYCREFDGKATPPLPSVITNPYILLVNV